MPCIQTSYPCRLPIMLSECIGPFRRANLVEAHGCFLALLVSHYVGWKKLLFQQGIEGQALEFRK